MLGWVVATRCNGINNKNTIVIHNNNTQCTHILPISSFALHFRVIYMDLQALSTIKSFSLLFLIVFIICVRYLLLLLIHIFGIECLCVCASCGIVCYRLFSILILGLHSECA